MKLKLSYDKVSDTLQIDWCEPYAEQDSRSIEKGVLARINPKTKSIENLEILDFESRLGRSGNLELPITGNLLLAG